MIPIHIEKYTMGFKIHVPIPRAEAALLEFAERLHAPKIGRSQGRVTTEKGDGYYLRVHRHHTFYFHIHHLETIKEVIRAAMRGGMEPYEFKETTRGHKTPYKCEFKNYGFDMTVEDPESPFYYQNNVVEKALEPGRIQTVFAIQTGRGKSVAHGTQVRIPEGWRNIEDLKVGDQVIGRDGKPANITGVFPQGETENYRVTFWDGRYADVCGEHLWQSFYVNTTKKRRWSIRTTLEMKRLISMPNPRVYIPLCEPEETSEKEFDLDPYLLGVLLGDGNMTHRRVGVGTPDVEVLDRISNCVPAGSKLVIKDKCESWIRRCPDNLHEKSITQILNEMSLHGHRAETKFIPNEYFEGSIEQRWELLRGLMDTDGTVNKDGGQPSFCSTSIDLAKGVQWLVRSLGGIASISERRPKYTYKGEKREGQLAYNVFIRHKTPSKLFHLTRKKELTRDSGQYTDNLKLRVKSIEPIGKDESTCISIDNEDKLFVLKDYVVQHNTKSSQKVMVKKGVRTAIIVRPTYVDKWEFDTVKDKTGLREKSKHVWIAQGVQGIIDLIYAGRSGQLDKKKISTIIIPTVSLQMFIRQYCDHPQDFTDINIGDFYNYIGVGNVIYDEVHEHFLTVYLSGICMNPPATVEMSATIEPSGSKAFIKDRYMERFPMHARLSVDYIPVVDVLGIYYRIKDPKFCGKVNRMKLYSHTTYEQNLYRHGMIDQYFEMVWDLLKRGYLANHQEGQKALTFFAMIQTCIDFKLFLEAKLKAEGKKLKVAKYNGGDSYDKFIAADIGVSTPRKAGTAVDIPGLVMAIVTIPIDDKQLNEQITGRPRRVTKWDITPKVCFLHALQISKHNRYLNSRKAALNKIVKSFKIGHSNYEMVGDANANTSKVHRPKSGAIPLPGLPRSARGGGRFKSARNKRFR